MPRGHPTPDEHPRRENLYPIASPHRSAERISVSKEIDSPKLDFFLQKFTDGVLSPDTTRLIPLAYLAPTLLSAYDTSMGKRQSPTTTSDLEEELDEIDQPEAPSDEQALITAERELLEAKIANEFEESFVKVLRRIAYYLSRVGLTLKEACQLVQYDQALFEAKMTQYPMIGELIAFKELEYKADLLATISQKARSGNDKLAMWLLESRYPDEFNQRKGAGTGTGEGGDDLIAMGVEFVQRHGDSQPLVGTTAGRAFLVERKAPNSRSALSDRLKQFMGTKT